MVGVSKRLQQLKEARETLRGRLSHKMPHCYTKEVISLAGSTRLHESRSCIQFRELHDCFASARLYQPHACLTPACRGTAAFLFLALRRSRACGMCARGGANRLCGGIYGPSCRAVCYDDCCRPAHCVLNVSRASARAQAAEPSVGIASGRGRRRPRQAAPAVFQHEPPTQRVGRAASSSASCKKTDAGQAGGLRASRRPPE